MKYRKFRNKKRGHYRKTAKTYRKKSLKKRTRKMRGGRSDELFYAIDKNDVNLVKRVLDGETILYKNKAKDMITGKKETDINYVLAICDRHWHDQEFFVAKAIGWALRDITSFDAKAVRSFLNDHPTRNSVARREAERGLQRATPT